MDYSGHNLSSLFKQLGRPHSEAEIARFIETCSPLPNGLLLHEATFWTAAEAGFLQEAVLDDADWAGTVDELNAQLHDTHH